MEARGGITNGKWVTVLGLFWRHWARLLTGLVHGVTLFFILLSSFSLFLSSLRFFFRASLSR